MRGRSGERGSGISMLAARHDDDDATSKQKAFVMFKIKHILGIIWIYILKKDSSSETLRCGESFLFLSLFWFDSTCLSQFYPISVVLWSERSLFILILPVSLVSFPISSVGDQSHLVPTDQLFCWHQKWLVSLSPVDSIDFSVLSQGPRNYIVCLLHWSCG